MPKKEVYPFTQPPRARHSGRHRRHRFEKMDARQRRTATVIGTLAVSGAALGIMGGSYYYNHVQAKHQVEAPTQVDLVSPSPELNRLEQQYRAEQQASNALTSAEKLSSTELLNQAPAVRQAAAQFAQQLERSLGTDKNHAEYKFRTHDELSLREARVDGPGAHTSSLRLERIYAHQSQAVEYKLTRQQPGGASLHMRLIGQDYMPNSEQNLATAFKHDEPTLTVAEVSLQQPGSPAYRIATAQPSHYYTDRFMVYNGEEPLMVQGREEAAQAVTELNSGVAQFMQAEPALGETAQQ